MIAHALVSGDFDSIDAVLFDLGGTLVLEAPSGTPVADLEVQLFPGVLEDLQLLRTRVRIGAVTNTSVMTEHDVRELLGPCGLDACLEVVVTSVDVGVAKPDPRPLLVALKRLRLSDPSRVLFVGNDQVDEEASRGAGTRFAWFTGGERIGTVVERAVRASN